MLYITIDGDDIGQKIISSYLSNNIDKLQAINDLVNLKTNCIADFLRENGFVILFCAADGVAGYSQENVMNYNELFIEIQKIAGDDLSFSVGVGGCLREAYVALLAAKSNGKDRLCNYKDI